MKVLVQQWKKGGKTVFSLSKDHNQLLEAVKEVEASGCIPIDDPVEIEISGSDMLSCRVQLHTVFLSREQEDIIVIPD